LSPREKNRTPTAGENNQGARGARRQASEGAAGI